VQSDVAFFAVSQIHGKCARSWRKNNVNQSARRQPTRYELLVRR
jgi:hypothetical protein